jgi:hypothetical protein
MRSSDNRQQLIGLIAGIGLLLTAGCGRNSQDVVVDTGSRSLAATSLYIADPLSSATTRGLTTPLTAAPATPSKSAVIAAVTTATVPLVERSAKRITVLLDADVGYRENGVFVPEYGPEAMRWETLVVDDPTNMYTYFAFQGEAEPGDTGCSEYLLLGDEFYNRANYPSDENSSPVFSQGETEESGTKADVQDLLGRLPGSVTQLRTAFGIAADPNKTTQTIVLTGSQLGQLINMFGLDFEFAGGTLDLNSAGDDILTVTITARPVEIAQDGSTSETGESVVYMLRVETLPATTQRLTPRSTHGEGYCK